MPGGTESAKRILDGRCREVEMSFHIRRVKDLSDFYLGLSTLEESHVGGYWATKYHGLNSEFGEGGHRAM